MRSPKKEFIKVICILLLFFTVSCSDFLNTLGSNVLGRTNPESCDKAIEYEKQAEKLKLELDSNPPKDYVERINPKSCVKEKYVY